MHSALQSPQTNPFSLCFFPQDIDGQALLLLTLPTVQECMELKLGPAIKLCHQIERVKVAFYAQYANWLHFCIPSCPPPCSLVFFYHFSLFKGFSSPLSFFFSGNKWNWKHWEQSMREEKETQKETSYKWNWLFCTCKAHGKTAGISPHEPLQPIAQWCKASMD